jgi:hypothetical protein
VSDTLEAPAPAPLPPASDDVDDRDDRVPVMGRIVAIVILGALLWFGMNAIEKWPFTGWRLYSTLKGPTAGSFFAYRLGPEGGLHGIRYHDLPDAYSRAPYLLEKFDRRTAAERERVCDSLANGEREAGREVAAIHIYWDRYEVKLLDGDRVKKHVEHEFRWSCADDDEDSSGEKAR